MKKRTAKDFISLYADEDEEKLVLIQSGTSADRTFLDNFWTAHTYALAMADAKNGQILSKRCYLSWPLSEKERKLHETTYFEDDWMLLQRTSKSDDYTTRN